MALILCPECGKEVSSRSKVCPNCGYPIAEETNDIIRIKIEQTPDITTRGREVKIKDAYGNLLAKVRAGNVAEIQTDKEISITFYTGIVSRGTARVSPKNGGKYKASWNYGIGFQTITCSRVDVIDA